MLERVNIPWVRKIYNWFLGWAEKPHAERSLAGFSAAESSFFPIPPDPLLMAMVFAHTHKWRRYALITSLSSILGGVIGYLIGAALFAGIGNWVLNTYHLHQEFNDLGFKFQDNAFISVLAAALTPIPYKIITISAGAFNVSFISFILASIIGRSARFFGVAYLAHHLGKRYKNKIEQYIDIFSIAAVLAVVLLLIWLS